MIKKFFPNKSGNYGNLKNITETVVKLANYLCVRKVSVDLLWGLCKLFYLSLYVSNNLLKKCKTKILKRHFYMKIIIVNPAKLFTNLDLHLLFLLVKAK